MALRSGHRASARIVYKLCSLLLQYPDEELLDGRQELSAAVAELPSSPGSAAIERFCDWWSGTDPLALQQHYVRRSISTSVPGSTSPSTARGTSASAGWRCCASSVSTALRGCRSRQKSCPTTCR